MEWLRFFGLLNASLWLGACIYHLLGAAPVLSSDSVELLLGPVNAPFFSTAIRHVLDQRFFRFQLVFALVAWVHILAMWLYMGRTPKRAWQGLLAALVLLTLLQMFAVQPKLESTHLIRYSRQATPQMRAAAAGSFRAWHSFAILLSLLQVAGLAGYYWRVASPPEAARFVSAVKFRS